MIEEIKTGFCPFCVEEIELIELDSSESVFVVHNTNPNTEPDARPNVPCRASGHSPLEAELMYKEIPISHAEQDCLPSDTHLGE